MFKEKKPELTEEQIETCRLVSLIKAHERMRLVHEIVKLLYFQENRKIKLPTLNYPQQ